MGALAPMSTNRLLLELARERNADLREQNTDLRDDNTRLRQENAVLRHELAAARRTIEEVMADAATARRAAAAKVAQPASAIAAMPASARTPNVMPASRTSRSAVSASVTSSSASLAAPIPKAASRIVRDAPATQRHQGLKIVSARQPASVAAASAAAADNEQREREAEARNAWRAERALAALVIQSHARALLVQQRLNLARARFAAVQKLQAVVRGNAARGIAERRRLEGPCTRFGFRV